MDIADCDSVRIVDVFVESLIRTSVLRTVSFPTFILTKLAGELRSALKEAEENVDERKESSYTLEMQAAQRM